ncbi:metalloprotease [Entomophthora muscae]|uniref:Metalloprotease n=1 Tax=Entomophthora muscae TaxID=34485 RepID=A0ACC2RXP8_9FUNG|nr:metalloprotease [Entomophthora muscae]
MKAWVLGLVWLVTGKLVPSQTTTGVEYNVETIASPKGDNRRYRLLQLKNDMEVLIVRQPMFKCLVVLDVRVGMRHDPPQRRGLAHLYEHALFNHRLSDQITNNSGFFNGETGYEHTVYFFNVVSKAFNNTLAMFADTLVTPMFTISTIPLDIDVVNQEFRDKQQSDSFRFDMVSRVSGNMSHPYTGHFGGNELTLPSEKIESLRNALYKLHKKYSSHRMRIVVMGSAPFSEQIETIVPLFTSIPKRKSKDQVHGDPFKDEKPTTLITTASIQDEHLLLLQFKLPSITHIPFLKAEKYIVYMLSQRSRSSIAAFLMRHGWGTRIRSGISETNSDFTLFDVEITLTPHSHVWIGEIVGVVLQAIEFIKEKGVNRKYMQEVTKLFILSPVDREYIADGMGCKYRGATS